MEVMYVVCAGRTQTTMPMEGLLPSPDTQIQIIFLILLTMVYFLLLYGEA